MNNVKLNCASAEIAEAVCNAFQEAHFDASIVGTAVVTSAQWGRDHAVVADIMSLFFVLPAFEVTEYDLAQLDEEAV